MSYDKNQVTVVTVATLIAMFLVGIIVGSVLIMVNIRNETKGMTEAIAECEKNLPRNKFCKIQYEAVEAK